LLYFLCAKKLPFKEIHLKNLEEIIRNGTYMNDFPNFYSKDLKNLVSFIIQYNPQNRPYFEDIANQNILKGFISYEN
jgi:hypothetical protein